MNDTLNSFKVDAPKATSITQLANAYPELPRKSIPDLYTDIQKE